ncbi:type III-A CRISPR-associated RAMP protein Csm5 (plasmid) [Deinococcus aquaticus]|uniref:Type III-A CRISPR-associated RAMP protein Csm5 n=2 Tax=Deinococcus aquaticus TaxID=328692 RepID=A0ABY7V6Q1_9DEIO|nr:type III-A CRISPR-associated RAMP protein Csm5 [Deinococcus aquaticus]WDA60765.1 type III-A CRISPR-associated RAMP protein Csm5 [Deinococcus aquaticus]
MNRNILSFDVRIRPVSPVHIGIGNEVVGRGAYHLYRDSSKDALALLQPRKLAGRLLDHYGDQGNMAQTVRDRMEQDDYPSAILREIESGTLALRRMGVHPGALPLLRARSGGLKIITAQANGLPYIPGSSVKGALRTAWLDWQTQQSGAYPGYVADVTAADIRKPKQASQALLERSQTAGAINGLVEQLPVKSGTAPNRDIFRAVSVGDLLPDRPDQLTRVQAVLSMSYQAGNAGFARPSNKGQAGAEAWECLDPQSNATYSGVIQIDLDLLRRMQGRRSDNPKNWEILASALGRAEDWENAISLYCSRFYEQQSEHYIGILGNFKKQSGIITWGDENRVVDWIASEENDRRAEKIFPMGMGVGLLGHSILGSYAPEDVGGILGEETSERSEISVLKRVLDSGIKREAHAYQDQESPKPKSRRVTGLFVDGTGKKLPWTDMRAERPLGWTELTLTRRSG